MTAKELIAELHSLLDQRNGEDVEVRMDVDFDMHYPVIEVMLIEGGDESDAIYLLSLEALHELHKYDQGLSAPKNTPLN